MRPVWSRILFTLAAMGARCCVAAHDEHPAERTCEFHGWSHDCSHDRVALRPF